MDYEKVLIPTDWSDYADEAVRRAAEIPGISEVTLLHVAPIREQERTGNNNHGAPDAGTAADLLKRDRAFLEAKGIRTKVTIEPSHHHQIARTILEVAQAQGIMLIAMGARGTNRIREALLGSVSHEVIRNARTHILLMHPAPPLIFGHPPPSPSLPLCEKVICPVDLSKPSDETVRSLVRCVHRPKVILLHVIRSVESARHRDSLHQRAMIRLTEFQQELGLQGITSELMVRTGDPVLITCMTAERENATVILLSRYGRFDYTKNIPIGSTAEAIAMRATRPVLIRYPQIRLDIFVRELAGEEFYLAEKVWVHYHQQKGDVSTDRIFAVFVEGTIAGVARCRRHPDGNEVDGVFILHEFRDRGYARKLMQDLILHCGSEVLYMHSTLELVSFYRTFGFVPIPEQELPPTIRERFNFALGNMQGSDVCPMKRVPESL
ncbi:MAG: GNAT family N-acetyltransferase [Methanoregula sp.]|nr:MAG: GNAT family N-acetyltransferase [Methanoregula sp.]